MIFHPPIFRPSIFRPGIFPRALNRPVGDVPSLDLAFALDKTLTARRGPTPTFSRGSGATRVNEAGLNEWAPENLLLQSQSLDVSPWIKNAAITVTPNTQIAPDGTLTADTVNNSASGANFLAQDVNVTEGTSYVFSFYAKKGTGQNLIARIRNQTSATVFLVLDYSSLVSTSAWTRISIPFTAPAGCTSVQLRIRNDDGVGDVHLWGAQLERASTARAYIPTTTAAVYGPRFDHDPVTLACKGLLIEEQRTNLLTRSAEFDNLAWTPITITVTPNQLQSPDGGVNADMVTVAGANQGLYQVATVTPLATYTFSVHVKLGTLAAANFRMAFRDDTNGAFIHADVAPSQVVTSGSWTRVTYAVIAPASCTQLRCYPFRNTSSVSGTFYLWGAQLEAGSFPTSYIPTTSATLTRSADVCSIMGANFTSFYNQSEWTLYADLSGLMSETLGGQRPFVGISDGTYSNFFSILKASSNGSFQAEALTSSVLQYRLGNAYTPYTRYKIALGVKTNDANAAYNGSLKTTDTTVTLPSTMNRLEFRDPTAAAAGHPSCHIARIQYFKKRLPNAKLQSITS